MIYLWISDFMAVLLRNEGVFVYSFLLAWGLVLTHWVFVSSISGVLYTSFTACIPQQAIHDKIFALRISFCSSCSLVLVRRLGWQVLLLPYSLTSTPAPQEAFSVDSFFFPAIEEFASIIRLGQFVSSSMTVHPYRESSSDWIRFQLSYIGVF